MTGIQKNGMATAGMICGIVGIVGCWLFFLGPIAGLLGIIFGAIGLGRAGKMNGVGRGAAITGLVCGIVAFLMTGLMAAIAIPAFLEYMNKGKPNEATLHLRQLELAVKSHYAQTGELPPSTRIEMPGEAEAVCSGGPPYKHPVRTIGDWSADEGWRALDFMLLEPSYYSYKWTRESDSSGVLEARSDRDCDSVVSVSRVDIVIASGAVQANPQPTTQD